MCAGLGQLQGFSSGLGCIFLLQAQSTQSSRGSTWVNPVPLTSLRNEHTWEMLVWQICYRKGKKAGLDVNNNNNNKMLLLCNIGQNAVLEFDH